MLRSQAKSEVRQFQPDGCLAKLARTRSGIDNAHRTVSLQQVHEELRRQAVVEDGFEGLRGSDHRLVCRGYPDCPIRAVDFSLVGDGGFPNICGCDGRHKSDNFAPVGGGVVSELSLRDHLVHCI